MPAKEIKTKLVLEGEQQYRKAMTDAANSIKVLNAEEKLAQAQFEATGDAEQYAATQTALLKEKIEEQKRAVAAAEQAVKALTDNGVKKNDKAMQTWRTKMVNAQTTLTRLQTKLNGTNAKLDTQTTDFAEAEAAGASYDTQLQAIGQGVNFEATILAIDNVKQRLETIIKTAVKAGKALWDAEAGGGKWADELMTAASQANLDVETYQSWQYASRFIDTSVDDIVKSRDRLKKELGSESEDMAKAFNALNVPTRNANGSVRDATEVFWDAVDALSAIEDETVRGMRAEKIFGESYRQLNPLISAGSKAYKDMAQEGRSVAVVSEKNVQALADFDDANQKVEAQLTKTKETLLGEMAPAFTRISDSISDALTAFNAFLETDEGQEALANLNAAVGGIADVVESVDWQEAMEKATGLVTGFTSALSWIGDHGELVVGALGAMGAVWEGLTVSKDVLSFLQLVQGVKNLSGLAGAASATPSLGNAEGFGQAVSNAADGFASKVGSAGKGLESQTSGAGDGFAGKVSGAAKNLAMDADTAGRSLAERIRDAFKYGSSSNVPVTTPTGGAAATGIGAFLKGTVLPPAAMMAAAIGISMGVDALTTEINYGEINRTFDRFDEIMEAAEGAGKEHEAEIAKAFHDAVEYQFGTDVDENHISARPAGAIWDAFRAYGNELLQTAPDLSVWDKISGVVDLSDGIDALEFDKLEEKIDPSVAYEIGAEIAHGMTKGIEEATSGPVDAATTMADAIADASASELGIESPSKVAEAQGENYAVGFANGIDARASEAIAAAQAMAAQVNAIMSTTLQIHSPSRVAEQMGAFYGEGFAIGVEDSVSRVESAVSRVIAATTRAPARTEAAAPGARGAGPQMVHVTLVADGRVIADVVTPYVNESIGELSIQRG